MISHSNIAGGYPGDANFDGDPLFFQAGVRDDNGSPFDLSDDEWEEGDYHITASSPCIDVADDETAPDRDADGKMWSDQEAIGNPDVLADVGAFDYRP